MRIRRTIALAAATAAVLSCDDTRRGGGGGGSGTRSDGGRRADARTGTIADSGRGDGGGDDGGMISMDTGLTDTGGTGRVPVPPMTSATEWPDTEPNDTPDTAVPVGRIDFALWMGFGSPNVVARNDDVDFYVFRTGDMNSLNVNMQICWSQGIGANLLDMYLWNVTNEMKGTMVRAAESTDQSCETLIPGGMGPQILAANSVYLLEIRHGPGLNIPAGTGMYGA